MEFVNHFYSKGLNDNIKYIYIQLLASFAPHLAEELWSTKFNDSVFISKWPSFNKKYLEKNIVNIAIQVNGKLRATIEVPKDISEDELLSKCRINPNVKKFIDNKEILREIYVPHKIVNIVIK